VASLEAGRIEGLAAINRSVPPSPAPIAPSTANSLVSNGAMLT